MDSKTWRRTRAGPTLLFFALLAALPIAGAAAASKINDDVTIGADGFYVVHWSGVKGERVHVTISTNGQPVDLLLMDEANFGRYQASQAFESLRPPTALSLLQYSAPFQLPQAATWYLVVDNGPRPPGGANSGSIVAVHMELAPSQEAPADPSIPGAGGYWDSLLFRADFFLIGPSLGVAGLTIWMLILAGMCWPAEPASRGRTLLAATIVTGIAFFYSFVDSLGNVVVHLVPPALGGTALGYFSFRKSLLLSRGLMDTYFASFLGTLVGADVLSTLFRPDPPGNGVGVIGGAGVRDALVLVPLFACGALLVGHALSSALDTHRTGTVRRVETYATVDEHGTPIEVRVERRRAASEFQKGLATVVLLVVIRGLARLWFR